VLGHPDWHLMSLLAVNATVQHRHQKTLKIGLAPVINPTIASYNASAVKIYNATSSLVRCENKTIFFSHDKHSSLLQRWRCSCKFKSRRIGSRGRFITYLGRNVSTPV
jgi:hypothetical protein